MFAMPTPVSRAIRIAADSSICVMTDRGSPIRAKSSGSVRWRSPRPTATCGSVAIRTAISRRPRATPAAASSIAITRDGSRGARRPNSSGCLRSAKRCRGFAEPSGARGIYEGVPGDSGPRALPVSRTDDAMRLPPLMSTATCSRSRAPRSPRRTSARGARARWRCASFAYSALLRRPKASGRHGRCSKRSPSVSATRRQCA